MKVPFVDLKSQYKNIKKDINKSISNVIKETAFIGGKYVNTFKTKFQKEYDIKHCIPVANGTDAIYITLKMLGVGKGDEVITTATSWISTSETISQTGAKPVFVDIDPDYYTIDHTKIREKITKNTKAIIPVHLYGQMADINYINSICEENNLFMIEDCAQSHFSELNGILAGKTGIASTFSFYPGKNLGAYGDAGCVITNDDKLAKKILMYSNHGALKKHHHIIEGINSRLDGLQAAILSVKLPLIRKWNKSRIILANKYNDNLNGIGDIEIPKVRKNSKHTFHLYVIKTSHRDKLKVFLEKNGISTAIHYPVSLPMMPAYSRFSFKKSDYPISYNHSKKILSLPMYPELSIKKIEYVIKIIKSFYANMVS